MWLRALAVDFRAASIAPSPRAAVKASVI